MNPIHYLIFAATSTVTAFAGDPTIAPSKEKESDFHRLWDIYSNSNSNNPVLQEFSLNGRLQLQHATGTSSAGTEYHHMESGDGDFDGWTTSAGLRFNF